MGLSNHTKWLSPILYEEFAAYVLGNEVKQFEEEFAAYTLLLISNPLKTELGIENLLPATFKNEYSPLFV